MGDCEAMVSGLEEEENLIAAAKYIVKALGSNKNLTGDLKKVLVDLGSQLSTMAAINDSDDTGMSETEEQLSVIQEKIMSWEADQSMIWDLGPDEAYEYLDAVDEARKLTERLEASCLSKDERGSELLRTAYDVLQTGMVRLEDEFKYLIVQNRQPFEPDIMSFRSSEEDVVDESLVSSFSNDSPEESLQRDSLSRNSEESIIYLVHRDVIHDLRCIATTMFNSNYEHECTQAYIIVRKDALDECLCNLEMEKLSIEDVLRMEWANLNSKIKRWVRVIKIFVRVYLASEKWLSDQIFVEFGPTVSLACFIDASKASMLQLLNFGEAIAIGPHQPEKLSRILDMYEVLADLLPDIDALFLDDIGSSVRVECHEVLRGLGDCVRATFFEFENAIASNPSTNPFAGCGVHHLTRYVMNYIRVLREYSETLNFLLKTPDREQPVSVSVSVSPDTSPAAEEDNTGGNSSSKDIPPMAHYFHSVASVLESNLQEKSKLYKDASLQHLFLTNNIHYMAQKVKNSELQRVFGDEWIRKHNWKFQQHAMDYERATWSSILMLLRDDGNYSSSSISKTLLKERFRNFYVAFEEVYKTQTAWIVSDDQLREDLRISASLKVIQAYRTFLGRHNNKISDKHIKYTADDLQNYLWDFFEGFPRSLHNPH